MDRINLILKNKVFLENYKIIEKYEIDRVFCKHSLSHFLDVARIMYIKNLEEKLDFKKEIIYAIALLHDIGRSLEYTKNIKHNKASKDLAHIILSECNFSESEIEIIVSSIIAHNNFDHIAINKLLREADKLSRNCFDCLSLKDCNWDEERKNKGITL